MSLNPRILNGLNLSNHKKTLMAQGFVMFSTTSY